MYGCMWVCCVYGNMRSRHPDRENLFFSKEGLFCGSLFLLRMCYCESLFLFEDVSLWGWVLSFSTVYASEVFLVLFKLFICALFLKTFFWGNAEVLLSFKLSFKWKKVLLGIPLVLGSLCKFIGVCKMSYAKVVLAKICQRWRLLGLYIVIGHILLKHVF